MQSLILGLAFLATSAGAQILVSGFDDNLRQSENVGVRQSLQRFFFSPDEPYTGMALLYRQMQSHSPENKLYILTGMPAIYRRRAENFLQGQSFPPHELVMRQLFSDWPTLRFKLHHIEKWMQDSRQLILVKDNSETSIALGEELKSKYGERLLHFYARVTSPREIPAWATPYFTPLDIALSEYRNGRLAEKDVSELLGHLLEEKNLNFIIPEWSYCPVEYAPCGAVRITGCHDFQQRVRTQCRARSPVQ
jgi:hypothetical protein